MPQDPFAEFAVAPKGAPASDPFAEFAVGATPEEPSAQDMEGVTPELYKQGFRLVKGPGWQQVRKDPNANTERNRPDNSLLGVPVELALVGGAGMGRAVGAAVGAVPKMAAGARAAATTVGTVAKYEVVNQGLRSLGVPAWIATPAAAIASGVRRGGRSTGPAPEVSARDAADAAASARMTQGMSAAGKAAPVAPAVTSPVAPASAPAAPVVAPGAAQTALSPQRIANEVGLAVRRSNSTFNEAQYAAAETLVGQGMSPAQAVMAIKNAGKSVNAAADLAQRLNLPTDADVAASVASRNRTGKWAKP